MTVKLGAPKYEKQNKNYFSFKRDQNTHILRILPPMGDLADSGKWSVYHRVEFGYTDSQNKLRPFLSPRVVSYDGMVEVESEAYKRREMIKSQLEQAKNAGNKQLQEQCNKMLMKYNQDAKHYMNAVDLQGNVGLFKIGHRGYQALKAEIEKLRSEGVDPIGINNGRYFVFSRSGKGRDTVYTVTEYKQKQEIDNNGQKVVVDAPFPHSINDAILAKLETDAFELDKIYPTVTPEEEYRIVNEGATAVDEILSNKKKENPASNSTQNISAGEPQLAQQPLASSEPLEQAPLEQAAAQPTGTLNTQTVAETTTPPPAGESLSEMNDEDFFKKIESGNF